MTDTEPDHPQVVHLPTEYVEPTPIAIIANAIERGMDPDKLGKLIDMHERLEAMAAVKAYNRAMASAQAEMPVMLCDSFNKQTSSKYISLEAMNKKAKPVYTKYGLSLSFGEDATPLPNHCRTTCTVMHLDGHSKDFYLDLPLDGVGIKGNANMTAIHGRLSSDTYAEARLLKKIFNITVAEDGTDTDGNNSFITPDQVEKLKALLKETGTNFKRFLEWLRIEALEHLPASEFGKAFGQLQANKAELEKRKAGAK